MPVLYTRGEECTSNLTTVTTTINTVYSNNSHTDTTIVFQTTEPVSVSIDFSVVLFTITVTLVISALIHGGIPANVLRVIPSPIVLFIVALSVGLIFFSVVPSSKVYLLCSLQSANANVLQTIFLPPLIFKELFSLNVESFTRALPQVIWLITVVVVATAALVAVFTSLLMPSQSFDWYTSFAFGGALSTTDPIAIILTLNALGAPQRLASVVGAESLLNDGTSIIIVTLFLNLLAGHNYDGVEIFVFALRQLLLGPVVGFVTGIITLALLRFVSSSGMALVSISLVVPFIQFAVSIFYLDTSGVLSLVPIGLLANYFGKVLFVSHGEIVEHIWDHIEFVTTSILYALVGLITAMDFLDSSILPVDWASMFTLYLWLQLVRAVLLFASFPLLSRVGYGMSVKDCVLVIWGGLRGAVSLILALSIRQSPYVNPKDGNLAMMLAAGTVVFFLINTITAPTITRKLNLAWVPSQTFELIEREMLDEVTHGLSNIAGVRNLDKLPKIVAFESFRRRHGTHYRQDSEGSGGGGRAGGTSLPHASSSEERNKTDQDMFRHELSGEWVSKTIMRQKRRRLWTACESIGTSLLDSHLITNISWMVLMRICDKQLDSGLDTTPNVEAFRWTLVAPPLHRCGVACVNCLLGEGLSRAQELLYAFFVHQNFDEFIKKHEQQHDDMHGPRPHSGGGGRRDDSSSSQHHHHQHCNDVLGPMRTIRAQVQRARIESLMYTCWGFIVALRRGRSSLYEVPVERTVEGTAAAAIAAATAAVAAAAAAAASVTASPIVGDSPLFVSGSTPGAIQRRVMFRNEDRALLMEVDKCCKLPAEFLDAVARYLPEAAEEVKSKHAMAYAKRKLAHYVHTLKHGGVLEGIEARRLERDARRLLRSMKVLSFPLVGPISVGVNGVGIEECPNFFPFAYGLQSDEEEGEVDDEARRNGDHALNGVSSIMGEESVHAVGDSLRDLSLGTRDGSAVTGSGAATAGREGMITDRASLLRSTAATGSVSGEEIDAEREAGTRSMARREQSEALTDLLTGSTPETEFLSDWRDEPKGQMETELQRF